MQSRHPVTLGRVDVGASSKESLDRFGVALHRRICDGRLGRRERDSHRKGNRRTPSFGASPDQYNEGKAPNHNYA
jgi:hypothetical protein